LLPDLSKFVFNENPLLEPPLEVTAKGSNFTLDYLSNCCKAIKSRELEISSINLYEVPREICRITNLAKLNLSDNKISMVRKELIELDSLEIVDLSENNLKIFPPVLCGLSLLMELNIGHTNVTRLPVQLGRLSSLKKLGLDGLQLIQPAAEIANLSAPGIVDYMRKYFIVDKGESRTLDISNVGFRKFPREIAVLGTRLHELSLEGNAIQDLTDEIGALSELTRFLAARNQLLNLPYELGHLKELVYLDVSHNRLSAFPNIHTLRNLIYLDASHNNMGSLPINMRRWTSLRALAVNDNELTTLPEQLGELERLTKIDASKNRLTSIPGSMKALSRLGQLNLKDNVMTKVPAVIPLLTTLEQLGLAGNRILALPPALCLCTNIKSLDVSYSHLIAPPAETHEGGINSMFSYLGSLYLAQFDKYLRLTHWNLQGFPLDGNFLTALTVMDLQSNQIRTLPPIIGFYAHLVNLNLSNNLLETLPEQIRAMHAGLTELDVSNNQLLKLPNGLCNLTSLIRLRMANNKLKVIPDNVSKLTMLRYLDLDFNRVQNIPETLASMTRLTELLLEDNPIKLVTPSSFTNCRSMRHLRVQIEWMDDMIAWRKNMSTYKTISGHGVKCPPTEVLMCGSDAIWKYLVVCANSRTTKVLELSRVTFWMLEMEDARQRFYTWPEDLCRYEHLERLNLAGNFLMTIHPTVSCLTNLVELDLESNRLRSLPTTLANCTALERIMLLRNPDLASPSREITSKGSGATIAFLRCLHTAEVENRVVFENASYRRVPIEILHLGHATDISISNNNIEFIPAEVGNLTNLTSLKMNKNKLVFLPDELCTLTQLTVLECENNNLCAFPDDLSRLVNLTGLEVDGNFAGNIPPEFRKVGVWLRVEYLQEVKLGRVAGHMNLRGFDLLSIPLDLMNIDRPTRWRKTFVDGYVRAYTEEVNKQRRRELEALKEQERRKLREAMGLDPDHVSEFSDTDAKFNATEEFCDDAVIHLAPSQVIRRRDRMRTFDMFCDSFTGWYACAIGYNSAEEMQQNAANDDDAKKKPSDQELYDFLVKRSVNLPLFSFGSPH
jgi:Leucine-rich repeat (LRR) protein